MNANHSSKLGLVLLTLAAVLSACSESSTDGGSMTRKQPTVEEVTAWRVEKADNAFYKTKTFVVSDLSCSDTDEKTAQDMKRLYGEALEAFVQCSYTVNASFEGLDKETLKTQDYEIKNHKVTAEKFGLLRRNNAVKWAGSPGLPQYNR